MVSSYVEEVVMNLGKAPETCYLTGSRAFNPYPDHAINRDYDFFAQHTDKMCAWLIANDFDILSEGLYADDPQLVIVYRHQLGVDVQLTDNVDKKMFIQNTIKRNGLFSVEARGLIEKMHQKYIWKALYEVAEWKQ